MNLRPSGYEPDELPSCSTPRYSVVVPRKGHLKGDFIIISLFCTNVNTFFKKIEKIFPTSFYIYLHAANGNARGHIKYMPAHRSKNAAPAMKGSNEIRKNLI